MDPVDVSQPGPTQWMLETSGSVATPARSRAAVRADPETRGSPARSGVASGAALTASGRLARADRLQRSEEFRRVMKRGHRAQGSHVGLFALRTASPNHRLGLAVSVGVGHSPARARMRRLLREAFRVLRQRITTVQSVDLVVLARQPWPGAQLRDVLAELTILGAQLRLMDA